MSIFHRDIPTPAGYLADGSSPYMKGRNGFTSLGSVTIESGRTSVEVRLELRSSRWVADPPALAMLPVDMAREIGEALIAAADNE